MQHEQEPRAGVVFQRMLLSLRVSETKRDRRPSELSHYEGVYRDVSPGTSRPRM